MKHKKKTGGRKRGQLAKAHKIVPNEVAAEWQKLDAAKQTELRAQGITPEIMEEWRHGALASNGDFSGEVVSAAGCLGKLVNRWKEVLSSNRINLELNQRKIEIPLPFLPGTFSDLKSLNEDQIRELKFSPTDQMRKHRRRHALETAAVANQVCGTARHLRQDAAQLGTRPAQTHRRGAGAAARGLAASSNRFGRSGGVTRRNATHLK
jgi:hypothetical protein